MDQFKDLIDAIICSVALAYASITIIGFGVDLAAVKSACFTIQVEISATQSIVA